MSTNWSSLTECDISGISNIGLGLDKNNFIVIDRAVLWRGINCIYKYNINDDKWFKINGFNNIENMSSFSSAMDVKNQILYLFRQSCLTQIELNSNNINTNTHNIEINSPHSSKSIIVNDSLFIVGGNNNNSILKWDLQSKTLTKFSDMYNKMYIGRFGMIYTNNCLLIFGGYDVNNNVFLDSILEFNMDTKQWNKLGISLPKKLCNICCTMGINNKYVLLFAGRDKDRNYYDDIYIYSLKNKILKQSKIKCPSKSRFGGITVNDKAKDEKLVYGYIRDIDCDYFPPYYLLKLIHSYYLNEQTYLFDRKSNKHYKISTLDI